MQVIEYLDSLGQGRFDQLAACALWAGNYTARHARLAGRSARDLQPARLIVFPSAGTSLPELANWLKRSGQVRAVGVSRRFVVAMLASGTTGTKIRQLLDAERVGYLEPDCDGPEFLTTSMNFEAPASASRNCWQRAARSTFPNDPCIDELWGHRLIGWDSSVAARSIPRVVAVLDSGIDASHEDLARNVLQPRYASLRTSSAGEQLKVRCATSGDCFPHGTEMAGTIGGRMDNGIGVAGVAPNSHLLPLVISRVGQGLLARLSTIAEAIDDAAIDDVDIINISAKWPVESRAISEAIEAAVGGPQSNRRLVVTGYATSLDRDDRVREYYPSLYRCLPGVIAAVPGDLRGQDLFNPRGSPNANDGRILAPGVDIVVTTTENSEQRYALSEAAGASSAAAYVSGAVALIWGSPPLDQCDAQQIKRLLFCRSKRSESSRYPYTNVSFLRELEALQTGAGCEAAMVELGCE